MREKYPQERRAEVALPCPCPCRVNQRRDLVRGRGSERVVEHGGLAAMAAVGHRGGDKDHAEANHGGPTLELRGRRPAGDGIGARTAGGWGAPYTADGWVMHARWNESITVD